MPLFALEIIEETWSDKFSFSSNIIPKCFWCVLLITSSLLKNNGEWIGLISLPEKITSCACFEGSGLKDIFHWKARELIFSRSWFKSDAELLELKTVENKDVSSANSFALVIKPSGKSLI